MSHPGTTCLRIAALALGVVAGACSLLLPSGQPADGGAGDADAAHDAEPDVALDSDPDGASDADQGDSFDGDAPGDADVDADEGRPCEGPSDCDDLDPCTSDQCIGSRCDNLVPGEATLILRNASGMVGTLAVALGGAGLSPDDIACTSAFEGERLIGHDFDEGTLGPFLSDSAATVVADADLHGEALGRGVRLCGHGSYVGTEAIDLSGLTGGTVALRFSLDGSRLPLGAFLSARISSDNGSSYTAVALAGDGTDIASGWESFEVLLPPGYLTEDRVQLRFIRLGEAGGHCGDLDEISLVRLGPSDVEVRLSEDFETGDFGVLVAEDPDGDLNLRYEGGGYCARLLDNGGATLTATVDSTGVGPGDRAQLSWRWRHASSSLHALGEYDLIQWSADGGTSWTQLSGTGVLASPPDFIALAAVLPAEALGHTDLLIRFVAPTTADNSATDGVDIDDVVFSIERGRQVDDFDPFEDLGGGEYRTRLRTLQPGWRTVSCQWQCGEHHLETEGVTFDL